MQDELFSKINNARTVISMPHAGTALYLAKSTCQKGIRIVVTPDDPSAEKIYSLTKSFTDGSSVSYKNDLVLFPEWDSRPEYQNSPSITAQSQRLSTLFKIMNNSQRLTVFTSIKAVSQYVPPQEYIADFSDVIKKDSVIPPGKIALDLVSCGYERTDLVEAPGFFSIKGNILDIYSPSELYPVRIEFFGDIVENIKYFDPSTQRSKEDVEKFFVSPVKEVSFSKKSVALFKEKLKEHSDQLGIRKDVRQKTLEFVERGLYAPGVEYYLPFFHDKLECFYDYLPGGAEIINVDEYLFDPEIIQTEMPAELKQESVPFPLEKLFINRDLIMNTADSKKTKSFYSIEFNQDTNGVSVKDIFKEHLPSKKDLQEYHGSLRHSGNKIIYTCHTNAQAERLLLMLRNIEHDTYIDDKTPLGVLIDNRKNLSAPVICVSDISDGLTIVPERISIVTENEVFGEKKKALEPRKSIDAFLALFKELRENDYVVHSTHGIGVYRGLKKLKIDGIENDFFQIEYSGKDMLLLPVYRLSTVQRYVAQGDSKVHLDKLGGLSWNKKRDKAKKGAMELAYKLIKLQAERNSKKGHAFSTADDTFLKFETEFEFDETEDQMRSINDVINDMEKIRPMDRLVCGDVGFGKTEVALRAAFKAACDNKQTAILVPTTVLAFQHYQLFTKRFKDYPVSVEMLTRFKSKKEQNEIVKNIKNGHADIIIGTHRLLSGDIKFKDLGLLIIDEEQRFGVKQKEKIKELAANVDMLTLTATPIPRTLNMALTGLKDISVITTAPVNRLPIKTFISKFSGELIRKALMFEIKRGGQAFFLHNRVQDISEIYDKLREIVPEAKIMIAHGQMDEKELERIMLSFYSKEADVLLCTAIIESGLDVPNANTIIINRADTFGLSQLYQIRGRVGRSPKPAYCYLLLPTHFVIGKSAVERIKTLQRFSELGSGFNIASYDLEFRGAGELLGGAQSGFIDDIGLEEYLRLIEEAVQDIKGEARSPSVEPEISINTPAYIPENYISNITQRLYFYKKLSNASDTDSLKEIEEELRDRYGEVPDETKNLFTIVTIKQYLKPMGISSIKIGNKKLVYTFDASTKVMPETIVELVTKQPGKYKINPDMRLISNIDDNNWRSAIKEIRDFISLTSGG
ncbi:MAG: transcription-repair coupling factor [Pseudomonadota bacterium]